MSFPAASLARPPRFVRQNLYLPRRDVALWRATQAGSGAQVSRNYKTAIIGQTPRPRREIMVIGGHVGSSAAEYKLIPQSIPASASTFI